MKAIINSEDNNYYASKVFAIKNDYLNDVYKGGFSYKYLVLNKDYTNLVFVNEYDMKPHIYTNVLIFDNDMSDMTINDEGVGKVDFISDSEIDSIIQNNTCSQEVLDKCKQYVVAYNGEYIDIKDENDIDNLMRLSQGFHDALINKIGRNENNELIILFDGIWGCKVEMIFSEDVEFQNLSNMDGGDPTWYGSTMLIDEDKFFFVDQENYSIDKDLYEDATWFKAKNIKYKIIPFYGN